MKVVRILIYDGNEKWMATQLGNSLPDGVKMFTLGGNITTITLPQTATAILEGGILDSIHKVNIKIDNNDEGFEEE